MMCYFTILVENHINNKNSRFEFPQLFTAVTEIPWTQLSRMKIFMSLIRSLPKHNVFCPQLTEKAWVSENRASTLLESVTASKYVQWDPRTTSHFGKMLLLFLWSIVFFRVAQLCLLCTIPNKLIDVEGKPGKSLLHPTLRVPRSKTFNNCPDGEYIFSFLFLYILLLQIALLLGHLQAVDFILQLVTLCIVSHLPHCSGNATSELLSWNVPVNGNKGSIWILWLILATHTHTFFYHSNETYERSERFVCSPGL